MKIVSLLIVFFAGFPLFCNQQPPAQTSGHWDAFLNTLQARTLHYFLDTMHPQTGLVPDRYPSPSPSSIAAVGFALTAYPIAAERGLISRDEACRRALLTCRTFLRLPQGPQQKEVSGYQGFYYHFLKIPGGVREWNCELSSIDTALFLAGVLFCQSYFDQPIEEEACLRRLADSLYRRVDWQWFMDDRAGLCTSWLPETGFGEHIWDGYDEAMILYILALGSPTHPVPASVWQVWTAPYQWGRHYGYEYVNFPPLFGHQFSHCWIDFRGIQDDYMRQKGIDYFENSRRATYAQRQYAIHNPMGWRDYGADLWGLSACDGPKDTVLIIDGIRRQFYSYRARGCAFDFVEDDGTIAPYAVGSSVVFAPEICIPTLKAFRFRFAQQLWTRYGFLDAFNRSYLTPQTAPDGWFDGDYLGIDQGPLVIMLENFRSGLVWETMKKNPYLIAGLRRAGFRGGWLDKVGP